MMYTIIKFNRILFGCETNMSALMMSQNISRNFTTTPILSKRRDILSILLSDEKNKTKGIEINELNPNNKIITEKYIYNQKWMKTLDWKYTNLINYNYTFITYDIETYLDSKGVCIPYLLGIYSPIFGYKAFYGENCVNKGVNFLLNNNYTEKIKKLDIYAHNAGNFDLLIIMKELLKYDITKMNYLENSAGSIISFSFNYNSIKFQFKDSYAIIPLSLNKAMKSFNVEIEGYNGKIEFNHDWVNESNINYIGENPSWLNKDNKEFNFKEYAIKYNEVDCKGLYYVIENFNILIINEVEMDISKCITLPQAAMKIFRTKYLKEDKKLKLFSNQVFDFLNNSYHGACVSVYKPYGKHLFYYDINSLYPSKMIEYMPVGKPRRYDVKRGLNDLFGFAFVKVECPKDLNIPILPLKVAIRGKETLIFPTGKFKGYFFSEELKYAESKGYKIELIKGLEFRKDKTLFEEYINDFYKLKSSSDSGIKTIGKLFLNTLYGRFGMKRELNNNIIVNNDSDRKIIEEQFSNIIATQLNENTTIYNYNLTPNPNLFKENPELAEKLNKNNLNILENKISNIAIASAITSYARIEIDKYKRIEGVNVYYSDTDSIIIDKPLPSKYIGSELGKMKNELSDNNYTIEKDTEYYIEEAIFIRDKVYSLKLKDGKIITKFSGLNKKYITPELFDILKDVYINNKSSITLETSMTYKDKKCFEIINKNINKEFVFKYNKRIPVYENEKWIDTKPIYVTSITQDLIPKIVKQTVLSKSKNTTGLIKVKNINNISVYNIKPDNNKYFDGYFLNYYSTKLKSELSIDYLLNELNIIVDTINQDKMLIKNIGFLISEEYIGERNKKYIKTIGYMESFKSIDELLNIYKEHLNELEESDIQSGNFLKNTSENNLTRLIVKIRIPDEYKEQLKEIFKEPKAPSTEINIINKVESLVTPENKNNNFVESESASDNFIEFKVDNMAVINEDKDKITSLLVQYKEIDSMILETKELLEKEEELNKNKKRGRKLKSENKLKLEDLINIKNEIYVNLSRLGINDPINYNPHPEINDKFESSDIKLLPAPNKYLALPAPSQITSQTVNLPFGNLVNNKSHFTFKSSKRGFTTMINKTQDVQRTFENYAIPKIPVEGVDILKPILNVEGELLTPFVYNNIQDELVQELNKILFILYQFPDDNFVKSWIKLELEQDKIIVNAKKNHRTDELLQVVREIDIETEEILEQDINSNWFSSIKNFNDIKRNNLHYNTTVDDLFTYTHDELEFKDIFKKETIKNQLYTCCYIISFDNKYYYYIGSTTNIKDRLRTHHNNIKNYINGKNGLNQFFQYFLNSEINYCKKHINFSINVLYLSTNYLNKFIMTHPDYRLSKGEWILLNKITDFIIKTLETTLLNEFQPKLNQAKKVVFKHFEWDNEYLKIYSKSGKSKEYLKSKKYGIYIQGLYERRGLYEQFIMKSMKCGIVNLDIVRKYNKIKNNEPFLIKSLAELCSSKYGFKKEEIYNNLNHWHVYDGSCWNTSLKIIEINE